MNASAHVVVVGGGPAGGFTALDLAREGCDVLLVESQSTSGWKIGETLPPEARIHLQRLRYWDRLQSQNHLRCHGVVSVWGSPIPAEKDFIFNPHGHGWQLDRARFESELLVAAASAGCRIETGASLDTIERSSLGWTVRTGKGSFSAHWLVDCTGRRGVIVGREGGAYEQFDELVSVFAIAKSSSQADSDARTYVEALPEGWCYSALMPSGERIVAFQTDRDLLPERSSTTTFLWEQLASGLTIHSLLRTHDYELVEPVRIWSAHSGRFTRSSGSDWIAVGDAAMTFDPLSGQGTAKALESSYRAVRAILHQEDYQAVCDEMWAKFVQEHSDFYWAEQRWNNNTFWSRRHGKS